MQKTWMSLLLGAGTGWVAAAPADKFANPVSTAAADSCTFTDAASAIAGKASCSAIILSGIAVPAGQTLDMTNLKKGTTVSFKHTNHHMDQTPFSSDMYQVTFKGTTSFGYKEWEGPLVSFSGTSITITGASGHVLDGQGAKWWDGKGSNGGKTKPKFFSAHKLIDSTISGLNILNTPVQCFSVNQASNLKIKGVSIDNSAGDVTGAITLLACIHER